jgi:hypothetical protein
MGSEPPPPPLPPFSELHPSSALHPFFRHDTLLFDSSVMQVPTSPATFDHRRCRRGTAATPAEINPSSSPHPHGEPPPSKHYRARPPTFPPLHQQNQVVGRKLPCHQRARHQARMSHGDHALPRRHIADPWIGFSHGSCPRRKSSGRIAAHSYSSD